MIRYNNLFDVAFSLDNLEDALLDAAKGKRNKPAYFAFDRHRVANLQRLHKSLHDGTYMPKPYKEFMVYEPKPRRIFAPHFADLVVQHAIYRVIYHIFDATFIHQSYGCRIGKGTHKASDYAQEALRSSKPDNYTLKLDVRKFFYRIDRKVLRKLLERKIKDKRLIAVMLLFCDFGEPVGIPIGNLLSQLYALIYLNPLDQYVKRELKVKLYCRYVDDFILFNLSKEEALSYLTLIQTFLDKELHLELSRWTLAKTTRGVNFVGYRTWASKRFIRKHSLHTFRKRVAEGGLQAIISILGHAKQTHSHCHLIRYLKEHNYGLYCKLPKRCKPPENRNPEPPF